jgi:hypothetical protein
VDFFATTTGVRREFDDSNFWAFRGGEVTPHLCQQTPYCSEIRLQQNALSSNRLGGASVGRFRIALRVFGRSNFAGEHDEAWKMGK